MGTCPSRRRTDGACLLGWTHLAGEEGSIDNTTESTNGQPAKKGLSRKGCLWVIIGAIAFIGVCGGAVYVWGSPPTESERFDTTLKDNLSPAPNTAEIVETCNAMESAGWSILTLAEQRGVFADGEDRITDIAVIIEHARWDYVSANSRSQLSWDRYHNQEEWRLYCLEKRKP